MKTFLSNLIEDWWRAPVCGVVLATLINSCAPAYANHIKAETIEPGDTIRANGVCLTESDALATWTYLMAALPEPTFVLPEGVNCLTGSWNVRVEEVLTCVPSFVNGAGNTTVCLLVATQPTAKQHPDEEFYTFGTPLQVIERGDDA